MYMCGYLQVNKYAFSGGQDSIEKHRQLGANLEVMMFLSLYFMKSMLFTCKKCVNIQHSVIEILKERVKKD